MKYLFMSLLLVCVCVTTMQAQQIPSNLSAINIDQLTDQQIIQYLGMGNASSMTEAELEAKAREKGLSSDQIQKLKLRIAGINGGVSSGSVKTSADTASFRNSVAVDFPTIVYSNPNELKVFGSELFSKDNLTFEPNLQIATPKNYVIGVGDQINIDLFGYSDANYKLKVSPEGVIRIPSLGPVKLAGLNFEDAQIRIKSELAKIYPQINAGKTSVQVSLGQIRSIRVTLIGEVERPGTYTLSSFATIANALYVSGGPNKIGSFRNIELIRNGKTIASFDLYDFLLQGDLSKNKKLEEDDIIKVAPYAVRVSFTGAVKRKAIYETKNTESLHDVLNVAGGFADIAYKDFVRVIRYGNNQKEAITVTANQYNSFKLQSGDSCFIDSIANRYANRVIIAGAVYHPGNYSLQNITDLKTLLQTAGIREDSYTQRATIRRRDDNYIPKMIDFNVKEVLDGKANMNLVREDSVRIYSSLEIKPRDSVQINGEVNKPGYYTYADSLQLQDLILMAGGFKEGASAKKIEISRRIKDTNNEGEKQEYAIVANIELNKDLSNTAKTPVFILQANDIVSVRKNPAYKEQVTVTIEGEVMYPGKYALKGNKETLSGLIQQAGGLRTTAYSEGAILLRNTFADSIEYTLAEDKMQNVKNQSLGVDSLSKILVNSLSRSKKIVSIHLDKALQSPNSFNDIPLMDSDILRIPKKNETVQTFGAVYVPKKIVYSDNIRFKDVVEESGGFLNTASRKKSYVMYPNGEVKTAKHFLFFKSYPKIMPGSEVYVPVKVKRSTVQEATAIGSAAASITALIISMIYLIKK